MRKGSILLTALLAVFALAIPVSAQATKPDGPKDPTAGYETVYWDLPAKYKGWTTTPPPGETYRDTGEPSIWPQTYDPNKSACGGWWQWDVYDTSNPQIKQALENAKVNGLESGAVQEIEWGFERQPECIKTPKKKKVVPKAPIVTQPTGKCWAGEWKIHNDGMIKLPKVANAKWVGYGTAKTLTKLAPGTYEFTLKPAKGAFIKDANGFVDGKIAVELLAPPQSEDCGPPPAKVKPGKWSKWAIDCEASEATKTRKVWTIDYDWNNHERDWVLDYKNAQTTIESKTRGLKEHELAQCPAPINVPPPDVHEGEWETTSLLCYLGVVSQVRDITTIEYGLVAGEIQEISRTVVQEFQDRPMNEEELAQCPEPEDPTVDPPEQTQPKPDPKPVSKPVAPAAKVIEVTAPPQAKKPAAVAEKAEVQQLPRTGSSATSAALLASGLLVAGIGALTVSRKLRRARQ